MPLQPGLCLLFLYLQGEITLAEVSLTDLAAVEISSSGPAVLHATTSPVASATLNKVKFRTPSLIGIPKYLSLPVIENPERLRRSFFFD
jgi:hypothetical protein